MFEISQPQTAPFLLNGDAMQAEFAHRHPKLAREPVFGINAGGERRDLLVGKACGGLTDHLGALAKGKVELRRGAHGGFSRMVVSIVIASLA